MSMRHLCVCTDDTNGSFFPSLLFPAAFWFCVSRVWRPWRTTENRLSSTGTLPSIFYTFSLDESWCALVLWYTILTGEECHCVTQLCEAGFVCSFLVFWGWDKNFSNHKRKARAFPLSACVESVTRKDEEISSRSSFRAKGQRILYF
jgi:hypothetical protein